ncbi:hypothetical protein LTR62_000070 [Meristemomyces frigidus]|uniref:NAD(P)-binding protein n=1 Tax=Meristemomyces frigidus TaxID=1508187 RepID=A0AAN7TQL0_9PEZI|nr:hypothetical protein LTR62_000070 [Meristemomyces frigidus]
MVLTVLTDANINTLLHSFNRDDILELQQSLADALHWYSTSNDANDCCSDFQPERTVLKRKDGSTTLFMPASDLTGQGIKVVNVVPPDTTGLPCMNDLAESLNSARSASSPRASISTTSTRDSGTSANSPSTTTSTAATSISSGIDKPLSSTSTIHGSLTLLDNLGRTTGLLNAGELTAFRTALASTMLLKKRHSVHDLTIFGAGKQAYWHLRLAMLLRPGEIHHVNMIARNFDSARSCLMRIYNPLPEDPEYVNPVGHKYNSKTKTNIITPSHTEYERLLKEFVRSSNVIFCTTPSNQPLFPATYLTNPEGRKKGRYIACIGSYKPHMIELHPDILRDAVAPHHEHKHMHRRQREGGAVIVDTVSGCLKEAGEIIQAKLLPDQVVELGELFLLKREAERKRALAHDGLVKHGLGSAAEGNGEKGCQFQEQQNSGLIEWLTKGNVIYKSVGLGLMDVVVGNELVRLAKERGVGTFIEDF